MAMRRIWRQLKAGNTWVVDADIADFFGTLSHSTLVDLVAERIADGKVLRLLRQFLEAGVLRDGQVEPTLTGVPQGGVASPLLSNVYLHVFDEKMAAAGYALTRYGDDWVITCTTRREAERALTSARAVLEGELGLRVHPEKTRIVNVAQGFEFLGYKIKQGEGRLRYRAGGPELYAYPRQRTIERFKQRIRHITKRRNPKTLEGLLDELNPVIRGWGNYFRRAHVRRLFHRLNGWIVRRIWSWRYKRWRNIGWRKLPRSKLYGELGLVNLLKLIPSMEAYYRQQRYSR
jgi:group II intron reverse transcriptase/maturase